MNRLFLTILLIIIFSPPALSQVVLTKKKKSVRVEPNKILCIKTPSSVIKSDLYYGRYSRKKKFSSCNLYHLDSVVSFSTYEEGYQVRAVIIEQYRDSVTRRLYSNAEAFRKWKETYFIPVTPVLKDTIFNFKAGDLRLLKIQVREPTGSIFGIPGLLL